MALSRAPVDTLRYPTSMKEDASHDSRVVRLPATEAAKAWGVSASAIRKRVERGSMPADKDDDGRLYVYVDTEETRRATVRDTSHDSTDLISQLRDENAFLRHELERKDAILLTLSEGLKALSPSPQPSESPETASEEQSRGKVPEEEERPWWRFWR